MKLPILGHNYIGGERSAQGNKQSVSLDARTGEPYKVAFYVATDAEIDAAVSAAEAAYPLYRKLSAAQRADFLDAIAEELDALGMDFVADVMRETALPSARVLGERSRTSNQLRLFAKVLRRGDFYGARIDVALPLRQPQPRPDVRQYKIGVGPVAIFGASNFPLAFSVAGGDTASALAAGCPVVVKAHGGHLATSEWVADAIERAVKKSGMPPGTFNMIIGDHVGGRLVEATGIKAVAFTGSLKGGRALFDLAAARPQPIPVFAEMSSINPIILLPQALIHRGAAIAKELTASVVMGCGQLCTSPGLLLGVRSWEFSHFVDLLRAAMAAEAPQSMLNRGILANYQAGVARLKQLPGIEVLVKGDEDADVSTHQAAPHLFQANAALLFDPKKPLEEEVFGPATVVVACDNQQQLLRFAASMHGQLTATLIGEPGELPDYQELIESLEEKCGRLLINGYPTGVEEKCGRLLINGYPTGVEVSDAMVHGGPYPATSDARGTSVGTAALDRFQRPVCYQNYPDALLPPALQNANPLNILRLVEGVNTRTTIGE